MLIIRGATIYTPYDCLDGHDLMIEGDQIIGLEETSTLSLSNEEEIMDASGCYLVPGFIDLQINGGFGLDFTANPETIWQVGVQLPQHGVTSFLPTIITSPLKTIAKAQEVLLDQTPANYSGAKPLGLHVEGPFLNPERKGAHNLAHLRSPSVTDYTNISRTNGVRLVTLAPELPGASFVIDNLLEKEVVVSAGHSLATYEQGMLAFERGIRYGTHIFNAMPPYSHFEPGLVGALLDDQRPLVGLIADGVHVHNATVRMILQTIGIQRLSLVTDAIAALGMPPGRYVIGDQSIIVDAVSSRLESGMLAGSILSMDQALRNLVEMTGCSLADALQTMTFNPARLLGLDNQIGGIEAGRRADLVILTKDLNVLKTICAGEVTYQVEDPSDAA
jgi:N-acetylglucosamine-6-phosphate deacetylase